MNQIAKRFEGTVKVGELPARIRDELGLPADAEVMVTVEPGQLSARDRMKELMDGIGAQADANGLTLEILDEILNERCLRFAFLVPSVAGR